LRQDLTLSTPRTIAIGDIHGCLAALETLLTAIQPGPEDTLITLGDYVDRGPNSRGVLERLMLLQGECRLIPLLGNHEEMLLMVYDGNVDLYFDWLLYGGQATLESYDTRKPEDIPSAHVEFLRSCRLIHEMERHFFVHGSYRPQLSLKAQSREAILWDSVKIRPPGPHFSGKTAIVGHASQKTGEILDLGYLKCIDTWCYGEGRLTALDISSGQTWQADKNGAMRRF
jgi:serine/threonine protein phosphatase 1